MYGWAWLYSGSYKAASNGFTVIGHVVLVNHIGVNVELADITVIAAA
jgi:hypothetical protein